MLRSQIERAAIRDARTFVAALASSALAPDTGRPLRTDREVSLTRGAGDAPAMRGRAPRRDIEAPSESSAA